MIDWDFPTLGLHDDSRVLAPSHLLATNKLIPLFNSDLLSRHRNKFHPNGANSDPPPPRYSRSKPPKPRASKAEKLKENKIELDTSLAKERVHDGQQGENSKGWCPFILLSLHSPSG